MIKDSNNRSAPQLSQSWPMLAALLATAVATLIAIVTSEASAFENDDENYVSYDSIVNDLTKSAAGEARSTSRLSRPSTSSQDPFENIWIHAGVGLVQNTQSLTLPNGTETSVSGRGIQAALGIDVLSQNIAAEGSVRSFGEGEDSSSRVSLKEFDLKVWFKTWLPSSSQTRFQARFGGGLTARYMTVRQLKETFDAVTPASVASLGGDMFLTDRISVGLDISARNSMVNETFDRTSYDGTLRVDTHF